VTKEKNEARVKRHLAVTRERVLVLKDKDGLKDADGEAEAAEEAPEDAGKQVGTRMAPALA
jgi:hypothetical protein